MPYRDEDAWMRRREMVVHALVSETDLERREQRAAELERFDRERREEARRRLPVIARARIASHCHEPFEAMIGEGAVRACGRCEQPVFDFARMSLTQAEALIASRGGACARLHRRADGAMMFADCEVGARGLRVVRAAAAVVVCAFAAITLVVAHAATLRLAAVLAPTHREPRTHHSPPPVVPGVRVVHDTGTLASWPQHGCRWASYEHWWTPAVRARARAHPRIMLSSSRRPSR
jgi:hypothetical protein